ncbi:MAG: ribosome maturation factor RimP [Desulfobacterales bacterium]
MRKDRVKTEAVHGESRDIAARVEKIARSLCISEGMELVHIEYQYEPGGQVLRVYIDKSGGVTLDNCVLISRQLNDLLDIHLEGSEAYNLEVSSPGPDRPLSGINDFQRFQGEVARIKTIEPIDGRKNFKGVLEGTSDGNVNIKVENRVFSIPCEGIKRARLVDYNGDK